MLSEMEKTPKKGILFIDEIQRIPLPVQKEFGRSLKFLKMKPVTIFGTTTRIDWLDLELKNQFELIELKYLNRGDMVKLIQRNSRILGFTPSVGENDAIISTAKGSARSINNQLKKLAEKRKNRPRNSGYDFDESNAPARFDPGRIKWKPGP
jgi:Holliday junction resolvasome RuvABC ATP-dependent DNA helicase subunit